MLADLLAERGLTGRDAAFATELSHGTARLQGSYLAILDRVVAAGTASLQPEVRTALLLGAHQVLSMRVPAHAAVGTTVELVRAGGRGASGADGQRRGSQAVLEGPRRRGWTTSHPTATPTWSAT